jgi:hypothetical protein
VPHFESVAGENQYGLHLFKYKLNERSVYIGGVHLKKKSSEMFSSK